MDQQDRPGWNPPAMPDEITAPEPPASRRSRVGTGVAVAAVAIGALGIAGTAYAASASTSPSPSPSTPGYGGHANGQNGMAPPGGMPGYGGPANGMPGRGPGGAGDGDGDHGMRGPGMGMGMGMGAIHGSFVTPKQGGGYQHLLTHGRDPLPDPTAKPPRLPRARGLRVAPGGTSGGATSRGRARELRR